MKKIAILLLALAALPAEAAPQAPIEGLRLVTSVTVTGEILRVGDIFENAGKQADIAIAYSPAPGRRAQLDADWLAETARRHDLAWEPRSRADHVLVDRASQRLGADAIQAELLAVFRDTDGEGELRVTLDDRTPELHLPVDAAPTLAIRNLRLHERSGRFTATIAAPADRPTMELPVAGRVFRVMEVPVPVHRVGRGEVIRPANVEMAKVPVNDIRPDTILASSELAGLEAVRVLRPGEPIRAADVRPEILVRKNSLVTVVLHAKGLQLSVQGKALDDGARGEAVRVMNTKSKRILEAEVEGPSMLSVGLAKFADAR